MLFQYPVRSVRNLQQFNLFRFLPVMMTLLSFSRSWRTLIIVSLLFFCGVLFIRYALLEGGFLPANCGGELDLNAGGWCTFKWLLIQTFINQRLGLASIICATLAFIFRQRWLALSGWLSALAGLVFYNYDYAALGAMFSLLILARLPAKKTR